jgi:nitrogen regulatory protein PII
LQTPSRGTFTALDSHHEATLKLITAVLQPESLDAVHDALDRNEARVMSAAPVMDDRYSMSTYRGVELRQPRARLRIEVLVLNDLAVPDAIAAIERAAASTQADAALLVVTTVDDAMSLPRSLPPADASKRGNEPRLDAAP